MSRTPFASLSLPLWLTGPQRCNTGAVGLPGLAHAWPGDPSNISTTAGAAPGAEQIWVTLNSSTDLARDPRSWPAVPRSQTALRRVHTLALSPREGWQTTGLFALPGEPVAIAFDSGVPKGAVWEARIGCHTDTLWHKTEMLRWPDMRCTALLAQPLTVVVSPYGGPLYLELKSTPSATGPDADVATVSVTGTITAPVFRPDMTAADWSDAREQPAPFAELAGEHIIFSLPSFSIRGLGFDCANRAVRFWDTVVATHCELAGIDVPTRPERVVCDVQISAGYMFGHLNIVFGPIPTHFPRISL